MTMKTRKVSDTKLRTRVGLYIQEEIDRTSTANDYYHVKAHPVIFETGEKIRNPSDDLVNGLYLHNLQVSSQGENARRDKGLYAFSIEYTPYAVRLRDAERMVKTLRIVTRQMSKLYDKWGEAITYGQYLARVADALGADVFVWKKQRTAPAGWSYDEIEHTIRPVSEGIATVDWWVSEWQDVAKTGEVSP